MSQASLVKQISENVPSVPEFVPEFKSTDRELLAGCLNANDFARFKGFEASETNRRQRQ
jgi:hypothetical protein